MKFNWKILVAVVIAVGISFWGLESIRARSYSGTELNFNIGSGAVTVTNPTDSTVPVLLTGTGSGSFSIVNTTMDITGSSIREGNGNRATQSYEFALPVGESEFSIARGKDITFIASANQSLDATVQPLNAQETQSTLIMIVVVVAGALFYISRTTDHAWLKRLRKVDFNDQNTQPVVVSGGQGQNLRAYGDNRANTGD